MKIVCTNKAPKAIGPYSQAIVYDNLIFCSGQIGLNPKTGELEEGIENQTRRVLNNLKEIVKAAGSDFNHILKTTIYLVNMADFTKVNEVYEEYFQVNKPARATIAVSSLPKGALIEIEMIALVSYKD